MDEEKKGAEGVAAPADANPTRRSESEPLRSITQLHPDEDHADEVQAIDLLLEQFGDHSSDAESGEVSSAYIAAMEALEQLRSKLTGEPLPVEEPKTFEQRVQGLVELPRRQLVAWLRTMLGVDPDQDKLLWVLLVALVEREVCQ
jgi:hypothetical protein